MDENLQRLINDYERAIASADAPVPLLEAIVVKLKRRKAGRPKLPSGAARDQIVNVRVSPAEFRLITLQAAAAKQSVSEWIRGIVVTGAESERFHSAMFRG